MSAISRVISQVMGGGRRRTGAGGPVGGAGGGVAGGPAGGAGGRSTDAALGRGLRSLFRRIR